jgi:hypothetical protein
MNDLLNSKLVALTQESVRMPAKHKGALTDSASENSILDSGAVDGVSYLRYKRHAILNKGPRKGLQHEALLGQGLQPRGF